MSKCPAIPRSALCRLLTATAAAASLSACSALDSLATLEIGEPSRFADQSHAGPQGLRQTPSRDDVLQAQTMLLKLGYHPGELNGTEGPETRAAIRRYQKDAGHPRQGRVTKPLLEQLARSLEDLSDLSKRLAGEGKHAYRLPADRYRAGDSFVYSDGRVETVVGIAGDMVLWEDNRGTQFTAYRNFILPPVEISSPSRKARTSIDATSDALWPLRLTSKAAFATRTVETLRAQPNDHLGSAERWRCRVGGPAMISVAAGTFDSVRIICDITTEAESRHRRVWYYAPSIGHYVLRQEIPPNADEGTTIELVAIRPGTGRWPPLVLAGLKSATLHALESQPVGRSVRWDSSAVDTVVQIIPTAIQRPRETYCRTYVQVTSGSDGRRIYPAKACRTPSGQWHIPGLDSESLAENREN